MKFVVKTDFEKKYWKKLQLLLFMCGPFLGHESGRSLVQFGLARPGLHCYLNLAMPVERNEYVLNSLIIIIVLLFICLIFVISRFRNV